MLVIFTIGLVLTVCVMRNGANDCESCCERLEKELAEKNNIYRASFSAQSSTNLSWLATDQYLSYETVYTNADNSFKQEVGIFVAPAGGRYMFNLEATSDSMVKLGMLHNDMPIGHVDNDLKSLSVIIEMAEKDITYVKVMEAQENATLTYYSFNGHRVC